MGESGHQYGQNFYTKIRTFLAKLPKQLILGSMELGQYHEVEVCQDFEAETFLIILGLSERMAKVKRFLWALNFTKS